jgi:hypothetical protein
MSIIVITIPLKRNGVQEESVIPVLRNKKENTRKVSR